MNLETLDLKNTTIEKHLIEPGFDASELNIFSEKKFIENHYKSLGYIVLDGNDFENNLTAFLKEEFVYLDPYIKVKLGKAKHFDETYAKTILNFIDFQTINHLLYLCRLCSYLGGPGFPDLIIINEKSKEWSLIFVKEDLTSDHIFFFLVSKLIRIKTTFSNIEKKDAKDFFELNFIESLKEEMKKERFHKYYNKMELYVSSIRTQKRTANAEDEIEFMRELMCKMPFILIKKWVREEKAKKEDFISSYEEFISSLTNMRILIKTIKDQTSKDPLYAEIGNSKDEDTIKKKYEYIMSKFGLGESRTKEIMEFFI